MISDRETPGPGGSAYRVRNPGQVSGAPCQHIEDKGNFQAFGPSFGLRPGATPTYLRSAQVFRGKAVDPLGSVHSHSIHFAPTNDFNQQEGEEAQEQMKCYYKPEFPSGPEQHLG
jgi:hypothetical protein